MDGRYSQLHPPTRLSAAWLDLSSLLTAACTLAQRPGQESQTAGQSHPLLGLAPLLGVCSLVVPGAGRMWEGADAQLGDPAGLGRGSGHHRPP